MFRTGFQRLNFALAIKTSCVCKEGAHQNVKHRSTWALNGKTLPSPLVSWKPSFSFSSSSSSSSSESSIDNAMLAQKYFEEGKKQMMKMTRLNSKSTIEKGDNTLHLVVANWTSAAELGHATAQSALGVMYLHGKGGVFKDEALAAKFLRMAAEQSHANSCHLLGSMYLNGCSVTQDDGEAIQWWRRGVQLEHAASMYDLAFMYEMGRYVAKDWTQAFALYQRAAEKGMADAQIRVGNAHLSGKDMERVCFPSAFHWFQKAATDGHPVAHFHLGACYALGKGTKRSMEKAAASFFIAAEAGHVQAQVALARLLEEGKDLPQDRERAKFYFEAAAQNGSLEAQAALDKWKPKEP